MIAIWLANDPGMIASSFVRGNRGAFRPLAANAAADDSDLLSP
jgi:hypothetical protein